MILEGGFSPLQFGIYSSPQTVWPPKVLDFARAILHRGSSNITKLLAEGVDTTYPGLLHLAIYQIHQIKVEQKKYGRDYNHVAFQEFELAIQQLFKVGGYTGIMYNKKFADEFGFGNAINKTVNDYDKYLDNHPPLPQSKHVDSGYNPYAVRHI